MPQTASACTLTVRTNLLIGTAAIMLAGAASSGASVAAPASSQAIPDFSQGNTAGWISGGADLLPPASGPGPVGFDPAHPHVGNNDRQGRQPTPRIGDAKSPILQPWAAAMVKKANDEVLAGKVGFEAMSTCWPAGVPGIMVFTAEPVYFVQTPKMVTMLYQRGPNQRRIYMNVPHSKNLKPSWYGESVGHYEGKTLVIDTVGMNDKTFVDNVRTPHTTKLHVVERYTMSDDGRTMDAVATVEDPGAFTRQWTAVQHYRRVTQPYSESVCAENNNNYNYFHLDVDPIPEAAKPDF
jgi:hypothetical protein